MLLVNVREEDVELIKGLPFDIYAVDATPIALDLDMVVEGMPVLNVVSLAPSPT